MPVETFETFSVAIANVDEFEKFDLVFGVPSTENDDCGCGCGYDCDYDCGYDYDSDLDLDYDAVIGSVGPTNTTAFA